MTQKERPMDDRADDDPGLSEDAQPKPMTADEEEPDGGEDPGWRFGASLACAGTAVDAALLAAGALSGALGALAGYGGACAMAVLCVLFLRDARGRLRAGRWARSRTAEFALPALLLLAVAVLLAHGARLAYLAPALIPLPFYAWEVMQPDAPPPDDPESAPSATMLPLQIVMESADEEGAGDDARDGEDDARGGEDDARDSEDDARDGEDDDAPHTISMERVIAETVDTLPPGIAARLLGWSIAVREEEWPPRPGRVVFGVCIRDARLIVIYRRPLTTAYPNALDLRRQVAYTVLHEVAHALGLDERQVRELGWLEPPYSEAAGKPGVERY